MPYLLLIVEPQGQRLSRTDAEGREAFAQMVEFGHSLRDRGVLLASESLASPDTGTLVKVRGGQPQLSDGPFAEAKEFIGGFFLLDCATQAEAVAIAAQCPAAGWCSIEVRAVGPCFG